MLMKNPKEYPEKIPTNIRLEKDVKEKVYQEARERKVHMNTVVNEKLKEIYSKDDKR